MKMINGFLALCLTCALVCFCSSEAMAQNTATFTASPTTVDARGSEDVTIDFSVSIQNANPTLGISLAILYDSTKVKWKVTENYLELDDLFTSIVPTRDTQYRPGGAVPGSGFDRSDLDDDPSTNSRLSAGWGGNPTRGFDFPASGRLFTIIFTTVSEFAGSTSINVVLTNITPGVGSWDNLNSLDTTVSTITIANPDVNYAPVFSSPDTFEVAENTTAVGTVVATDANSEDNVTYAFTGSSADTTDFNLDLTTGALTFKTAPDFETPTDRAITAPSNAVTNNEYLVIVQATGGAGDRAMTANDTIIVKVTDVTIPIAPTSLQATAGDGEVALEWDDPLNPSITSYEYSTDSGASWVAISNSGAGTTSYTVTRLSSNTETGLTNNTEYTIQLRAVNAEGNGAEATSSPVTPLSSDANLEGLTLSEGTLSPTFDSATTAYRATVPNATASLTVTPDVNDTNMATIEVIADDTTAVGDGVASNAINLAVGDNEISVVVTAQNTTTTKTYTVTVLRQIAVTGGTGTTETEAGRISTEVGGETVRLTLPKDPSITAVTLSVVSDPETVADRPPTARFATSERIVEISLNVRLPQDSTAVVCLPLAFNDLPESQQLVYHLPQGESEWRALPRAEPPSQGLVCGVVTTFSPFVVGTVERPDTSPAELAAEGGDKSITLNWANPENPTLTGYQTRYKTVDGEYNEWTAIDDSDESTTSFIVLNLENGLEYVVQLAAINSGGRGPTSEVTALTQAIPPPVFTDALDPLNYQQGTPITPLKFPEVIGGEGQLTYELTPSVGGLTYTPPGDEDQHSGILSGTPTEVKGRATYTLTVTDEGGTVQSLSFILVVVADLIPTFGDATVAVQDYKENQEIDALTLPQATGGDGTLTYVLTPELPEGLTFDVKTRVLSGTPLEAMDETTYTLTVEDADSDRITLPFTLGVRADLMPIFGDTLTAQSYMMGTAVNVELPVATGGDGTLSYLLLPSPPDGLSFDPETRVLSGIPTTAMAETEYMLTAFDADGDKVSLTFTLEVPLPSPDFDDNGQVNFADFLIFADKFGTQRGSERYDARCDLNGDGQIGFDDFLIFSRSFGSEI